MSERLEELHQRVNQIASDSENMDHLFARAIAGMLYCVPHVREAQREEGLAKAQEGIDLLTERRGEYDEIVTVLCEMHALAVQEAG